MEAPETNAARSGAARSALEVSPGFISRSKRPFPLPEVEWGRGRVRGVENARWRADASTSNPRSVRIRRRRCRTGSRSARDEARARGRFSFGSPRAAVRGPPPVVAPVEGARSRNTVTDELWRRNKQTLSSTLRPATRPRERKKARRAPRFAEVRPREMRFPHGFPFRNRGRGPESLCTPERVLLRRHNRGSPWRSVGGALDDQIGGRERAGRKARAAGTGEDGRP